MGRGAAEAGPPAPEEGGAMSEGESRWELTRHRGHQKKQLPEGPRDLGAPASAPAASRQLGPLWVGS